MKQVANRGEQALFAMLLPAGFLLGLFFDIVG
jgi:hypothetical protein